MGEGYDSFEHMYVLIQRLAEELRRQRAQDDNIAKLLQSCASMQPENEATTLETLINKALGADNITMAPNQVNQLPGTVGDTIPSVGSRVDGNLNSDFDMLNDSNQKLKSTNGTCSSNANGLPILLQNSNPESTNVATTLNDNHLDRTNSLEQSTLQTQDSSNTESTSEAGIFVSESKHDNTGESSRPTQGKTAESISTTENIDEIHRLVLENYNIIESIQRQDYLNDKLWTLIKAINDHLQSLKGFVIDSYRQREDATQQFVEEHIITECKLLQDSANRLEDSHIVTRQDIDQVISKLIPLVRDIFYSSSSKFENKKLADESQQQHSLITKLEKQVAEFQEHFGIDLLGSIETSNEP